MKNFFYHFSLLTFLIISTSLSANTTSSVKGKVVSVDGSAISGAVVEVVYTPTGSSRVVNSDSNGQFNVLNLQVGGPYNITAKSPSGNSSVEGVFLNIGKTTSITLALSSMNDVDEVIVTAQRLTKVDVATGPSAIFGAEELASAAAYDRDIKELLQTNPRLYIDDGYQKGLQCNGQNPRYNSLTVDGIALNDGFGLNDNGYPTNRMPFSYDSIKQVAAEFAPFDVTYGGFSSCVVNTVTKSGSNEFKGNFFYEMASDDLQGDELEGKKVQLVPYDEAKYGFTLGGPIIENKLYFFTSYERYDDQDTNDYGYIGSGLPIEQSFLSESMFNRIVDASKNLYGFDPGGLASALDSKSDKLLVKLDYYLNDTTRAVYTFNYTDGFNNVSSDASSSEFEFDKHFYTRGNELMAHMFKVFTSYGDFNTEIRVGYRELDNSQVGKGGSFGDFQIDVTNPDTGDDGTVYLGGTDDSRQANKLDYDNLSLAFITDYQMDNQLITFGIEYEDQSMFNMFVQHSLGGEWDFDTLEDFENGIARVYYGNAPSLDPTDAGANWSYDITTLFAQSEYQFSDKLEITYGLRYEKYGVSGSPALNQNFVDTYGYANTATYDGADVLMPRLSFSLDLNDTAEIYGGYGVFSGGNPNVWYSNMWSNDGVTAIQLNQRNVDVFNTPMCDGRTGQLSSAGPGYAVPCFLVNDVQNGSSNGDTNTIARDFEIPTVNKLALGLVKYFESGPLEGAALNVDYISATSNDAAVIRDIAVSKTGEYDHAGVPYY
ncbi:MAG: TonB-dependent receptor, partial [Gammaproteobacteria bacterium]